MWGPAPAPSQAQAAAFGPPPSAPTGSPRCPPSPSRQAAPDPPGCKQPLSGAAVVSREARKESGLEVSSPFLCAAVVQRSADKAHHRVSCGRTRVGQSTHTHRAHQRIPTHSNPHQQHTHAHSAHHSRNTTDTQHTRATFWNLGTVALGLTGVFQGGQSAARPPVNARR